ncbi:hypothetical protein [endosymbiont GvMRE of Glomus versiforme]|uniref:hypothetical protein n=1 Tax=endosymbiont GvMRE of Glomus versiforme TaxID=2039283 RepID=UPI000EBBA412|nr:hypothetical protein [endosymbiont GvMRE of Glomus versiforme]RHZ37572.1 hypothetical protein GvMRE_I1g368 [endosymbiont GvMRE of Glomus versiforme]
MDESLGKKSWEDIHMYFAVESYQDNWEKNRFNYQTTKRWADVLGESFEVTDWAFCVWLRGEKNLTSQEVEQQDNAKRLKAEYQELWIRVHPDFTRELQGKTYQQKWEEAGLTVQEAQEWISIGLKPNDLDYCAWLKVIKEFEEKGEVWWADYNDEFRRKEYEEFLKGSKLGLGVIKQLKKLDINNISLISKKKKNIITG